jgi:hypothetical protein
MKKENRVYGKLANNNENEMRMILFVNSTDERGKKDVKK